MAAPPDASQIPPPDSTNNFAFDLQPNPLFIHAAVNQNAPRATTTTGTNHDAPVASTTPPAPVPAPLAGTRAPSPPARPSGGNWVEPNGQQGGLPTEAVVESVASSGSEQEDSEAEWSPIEEDKSEPCQDELAYIGSKLEFSALDHVYWEEETFFDLDDPAIAPVGSGRIDWLVDRFHGTKENPNNEICMRSPTVNIGGYDWRLKFYPKGNKSDYLSVYLENVTMQSPDFVELTDYVYPPMPFLTGLEKVKKRNYAAVQLSIVMYNPAEPRVHEVKTDAHQFTKKSSDYGWTRFSRHNHRDFPLRNHGQRQAILRDDKLAFSAYIRVVDDPTGCLWAHGPSSFDESVASTGLRPFSPQHPQFSAFIPLLHFGPFRDFIYRCTEPTKMISCFQVLLFKMLSRSRSHLYGQRCDCVPSDTIAWLQRTAKMLRMETVPDIVEDLIGTFEEAKGAAVCGNRLKTKDHSSVQAAIDAHPSRLACPAFLTLELERQQFDRERRKWNKLTNKVEIPNKIKVPRKDKSDRKSYTLYAFVTHCGSLTSNKFNFYVRPNGLESGWYAYTEGKVTCLTHKQAVDMHCGWDPSEPIKPKKRSQYSGSAPSYRESGNPTGSEEVAHVVMYVRDDVAITAFGMPVEESWNCPEGPKHGFVVENEEPSVPPQDQAASAPDATDDQDHTRRISVATVECTATPEVWHLDHEGDVVMSDADDDSVDGDDGAQSSVVSQADSAEAQQPLFLLDYLGIDYYAGPMQNGKYHGQGHWISQNGNEYEGEFVDGQPHGQGKMTYSATGDVYQGAWQKGQHHGIGQLTERSTGNAYAGGWKEGKKHGAFTLRGTVTEEDRACCTICYDREINTAFYDCGHVVACRACAGMVDSCPVCRRRVIGRLELFGVKMTFD